VPSVLLDGSPVSPPDRFATVIARHQVSVLKAGSTFLRMLMTMPAGDAVLQQHDLRSLRLGTFCAEPVNKAVHSFAQAHLTPNYINSYWATEHGGIVWSRCHGNVDQPVRALTRTWPLPWIAGDVIVRTGVDNEWRAAADGEHGEVVIRRRYPYQALTVWQSAGFGDDGWRGDMERWGKYFELSAGYMQGDAAIRHTDGAYTFHGRSDEVINVGGNRIGTEEIESALLADLERADSPLRNCVVVGMADEVLGSVPVAFVVLQRTASLGATDEGRLRTLVQRRVSSVAVPAKFIVVASLPETYSGKFMRALLEKILAGSPVGDLGALKNPECVEPLQQAVHAAVASRPSRLAAEALDTVLDVVRSLTGSEQTATSKPLMDVGIDSLAATHLVAGLQQRTGLQLSSTLIFEHSTADAVAQHLARLLDAEGIVPQAPRVPSCAVGTAAQPHLSSMIGRWPHGSSTSACLWRLLSAGSDAVSQVPVQRWRIAPSSDSHEQTSRFMANVRNAELFDGEFFSVPPAEATATDPQQRLLLECGHAAVLIAGFSRANMQGSNTGVFLGITNADFATLLATTTSVYAATGGTISIAAGRLSFVMGLHGPCESLDTACSSAVVALHSSSLCIGAADCPQALTAAVSLYLTPRVSISYARAGMLSPDGRCKTFDASANGYVRGEGLGTLLVSQQKHARARAELNSSTVQQDGMSASLTAPNGSAQITLLELVIARATADRHRGVESHGTGTPLGDPTEMRALARALPTKDGSRWLGGAKANTGHLEPAAGMIGLLKLTDTLLERRTVTNAQLRALNRHLAPSVGNFALTVHSATLDSAGKMAGVSSFGYSGTIAHALLAPASRSLSLIQPPLMSCRRRTFVWEAPQQHGSSSVGIALNAAHVPFLGISMASNSIDELLWQQQFNEHELGFLQNHRVGQVALLPGTCYIEMARAMVRVLHGETAFALTAVKFMTIMFLDDELDGFPTVRVSLQRSHTLLSITSRREDSSWDTHSEMELQVRPVETELLDVPAVQTRCVEHVSAEAFYQQCGNDYQGEFKSMQEASGRDGGVEILSKVAFDHMETEHMHLRSCAWLDACLHAPYWWSDHRSRPFYIASVTSYGIRVMDVSNNQVLWSLSRGLRGSDDLQPDVLKYHSDDGRCCVQIDGSRLGFFEVGWL
jgi:3-oxoacyl-(acyl-carrier-protein) synthase/acyl carrier protein